MGGSHSTINAHAGSLTFKTSRDGGDLKIPLGGGWLGGKKTPPANKFFNGALLSARKLFYNWGKILPAERFPPEKGGNSLGHHSFGAIPFNKHV